MLSRISLIGQSSFYVLAGLNHFINPDFYIPLIPDYLPEKSFTNIASGIVEILLGLGLLSEKTIKLSAVGIIMVLIAFIPSHIHFIQVGSCVNNSLCVSPAISWIRLVIIHPILIVWALCVYHSHNQHPLSSS